MDYVIKNCPLCKRELPVPDGLKECICMYCGEHFHIDEAMQEQQQEAEGRQELEAAYLEASERIGELVGNHERLLQRFTREGYRTCFEEYAMLGESILLPIQRYARLSDEVRKDVVGAFSLELMATIDKYIKSNTGLLHKNSKAVLIDQYRYFLAVYLVPMIGYLKLEIGDLLADRILEEWKKKYPKCEFKKATYEEMAAGFLRKGFCFITSAVCETLNKPDDCYELERFRDYRDHYLMNREDGRKLVEEYYLVAPRIVAYLNIQPGSEERYRKLWIKYLQPCLKDIEHSRSKRCQKRYVRMVHELNRSMPFGD